MAGKLLIDAHYNDETRIAIVGEDGKLENFEAEYSGKKPIKGNIYLAKIVRIEPSIQAAFIDYGGEKNGFLPLTEIHSDYFNKNVLKSLETEKIEDASDGVDNDENKTHLKRQIKIQEAISTKQVVLVQAEKEIRGNKCAFFTTFITLPGKYCVLVPNPQKGKGNFISKRIEHSEQERLKDMIASIDIPEGMNCIVRTAGAKRTKQEIKRDIEYLCRLWNEIRNKITNSIAPTLIHEEGNIIKRTIRDLYQRTMDKIIIQGKDAYKEARSFMKTYTPAHVKKIELYNDTEAPLFHKYNIEDKIGKILEPTVSLPSGGTIVINTTEALTAIDVNSGKSKHERDIEVTAFKTNLEAVKEIGRQIKLRDIGGIIVIDFIDMVERRNQERIEKAMRDSIKNDYSNIQLGKLSQFGLMEISRQRLRTSLADATFIQCSHCAGSGKVLANETIALSVIRKIENFLVKRVAKSVIVDVAPGVDLFILNRKRNLLIAMEQNYDVSIEIVRNKMMTAMDCKIFVKEYVPSEQRSDKAIKEEKAVATDNENHAEKKLRKIKKVKVSKKPVVHSSEKQSSETGKKKLIRVKRRRISDKNVVPETVTTTPELTKNTSTDNLPANTNKKKGWLRKIFE